MPKHKVSWFYKSLSTNTLYVVHITIAPIKSQEGNADGSVE